MANVLVRESSLEAIADAIREKLNVETTYKPSEMANAIGSIGGGSTPVINPLSVTENGTYTAPSGVDGYSPITVNVPQGSTPSGTKQISITENGTTIEDVSAYANAEITVNVPTGSNNGLSFDLKSSWVDENAGYIEFLAAGTGYQSVTITNEGTVIGANNCALALRGIDLTNKTVEIKCGSMASSVSSGHQRLVCFNTESSAGLIMQQSSTWKFYTGSAWVGSYGTDKNQYSNKTLKFVFGTSTLDFYVDDDLIASNIAMTGRNCIFLGSTTTAFTRAVFESVTIKNNQ